MAHFYIFLWFQILYTNSVKQFRKPIYMILIIGEFKVQIQQNRGIRKDYKTIVFGKFKLQKHTSNH